MTLRKILGCAAVAAILAVPGCQSTGDVQALEARINQSIDEKVNARVEERLNARLDELAAQNVYVRHDAAAQADAPNAAAQAEAPNAAQAEAITVPDASQRMLHEGQLRTADEQNTIEIFTKTAPGTVYVTQNQLVRDWRSARAMEVPVGEGSGFIWDKEGHIVTNYHVIDGASTLTVKLYNKKSYPARLVGGEPKKDIAVLKIDAPAGELAPIGVPEDSYELMVGQKTIAIGNPFGLDHSLTTGIISAIGRDRAGYGGVTIRDMIQTDASINPGNSGGPLLDSGGNLIGMNTMIQTKTGESAGIGFAVPYMTIKSAVTQIINTGHVQQIGLGISILDDRVAMRYGVRGVIIRAVSEDSPAYRAGLRGLTTGPRGTFIGDIIVGIDDTVIAKYDDLYSALDRHQAGDTVQVKIRRGDSMLTIPVEVYVLP